MVQSVCQAQWMKEEDATAVILQRQMEHTVFLVQFTRIIVFGGREMVLRPMERLQRLQIMDVLLLVVVRKRMLRFEWR